MGALAILKYHYSSCHFIYSVRLKLASRTVLDPKLSFLMVDLRGSLSQVGSLAGAAHLLNLRTEISTLTKRRKACLILICSTNTNCENMATEISMLTKRGKGEKLA